MLSFGAVVRNISATGCGQERHPGRAPHGGEEWLSIGHLLQR